MSRLACQVNKDTKPLVKNTFTWFLDDGKIVLVLTLAVVEATAEVEEHLNMIYFLYKEQQI
jgi:hypothetical protein